MSMTEIEFTRQVVQLAASYDRDNTWFKFKKGGQTWSKGAWPDFIIAAWHLYQNACQNRLNIFLLGDTKIRSDEALIMNFGLVSNCDTPQEAEDIEKIAKLTKQRAKIAQAWKFKAPAKIMGTGSILSAQRWSPLLNDALMLGGIQNAQEFHLALNEDEQVVFDKLSSNFTMTKDDFLGASEFERRRSAFGAADRNANSTAPDYPKKLWLQFLRKEPRVLWEKGLPRVFVRELLGLHIFGYEPEFNLTQLSFRPPKGDARKVVNFETYLKGLHDVGYHTADRAAILTCLSEFLFKDPKALDSVGTSVPLPGKEILKHRA